MRVLGIIPARGGSKGIPKKNIKSLGGKPLLEYTFESVQKASLLTNVILSSDDEEIISLARKMGLEVPFRRPAHLAEDDTPSLKVIQHALKFYRTKGEIFDAVCLLQVTSPFREESLIDQAIHKFVVEKTDSLISVKEVPEEYNPHWIFESDKHGHLHLSTGEKEIISRRQALPGAYYRDGAVYITKAEVILDKNSLYGDSIGFIVNESDFHINIDTPEDWRKAEEIVKKMSV